MALFQPSDGTNIWLLGTWHGAGVAGFHLCEGSHPRPVPFPGQEKIGVCGRHRRQRLGDCLTAVYVREIPLAASFSRSGIKDDWLAAFMMSSILLNPQLIVYSMALGPAALRCASCPAFCAALPPDFLCGTFSTGNGSVVQCLFCKSGYRCPCKQWNRGRIRRNRPSGPADRLSRLYRRCPGCLVCRSGRLVPGSGTCERNLWHHLFAG